MKTKLISYAVLGFALISAYEGLAQPVGPVGETNYLWTGAGDAKTWSSGANWRSTWLDAANVTNNTTGIAPVNDGTTFQIYIGTGSPTATPTPINIAASDHVVLNDQLFGPEWGETLNIYGTVSAGFGFAPVGAVGGPISTVNIYSNGVYASDNSVFIGDMFWFNGGPGVNFNLYDNAQLDTEYLALGGHLTLYGGVVTITNAFLIGPPTSGFWNSPLSTDATRQINIIDGMMILPGGSTATVQGFISRGIFLAYGKAYDTNDLIIDEANTNYPGLTVVSGVPLGAMLDIQLQLTNSLLAGAFVSATITADFTGVSGAVVTGWPNITPRYSSSATGVATVTSNGQVHAVSPGKATITATVGTFSNSVVVTVTPAPVSLIHRYSFSETSGTDASDSIGGSGWDGALNGGATFSGGQVLLDGTNGFVQLPAGIITNMDAVTVETWASFGAIPNWAVLFTFGDTDPSTGLGMNYISCQPHTGFATTQIGISDADPGYNHEEDAVINSVQDGRTNLHIVAVYYPTAGYSAIYTNGILATINTSITISLANALATGDPLNYIGRSLYSGVADPAPDPYMPASVDEFRIYNGPLQASAIMADFALGPNQLIGSNTNVSLAATVSGGNLHLTWPANSALVSLVSSPTLGREASWTPMIAPLVVTGGHYQATIPISGASQFFRLQQ